MTELLTANIDDSYRIPHGLIDNATRNNHLPLSSHGGQLQTVHIQPVNVHSEPKRRRRRNRRVKGCNCRKSKCLKLYCECFAKQTFCSGDCKCNDCNNIDADEFEDARENAIRASLDRNSSAFFRAPVARVVGLQRKGCKCKKSMCAKNYCECYQSGLGCTERCRCKGCQNEFGVKPERTKRRRGGAGLGLGSSMAAVGGMQAVMDRLTREQQQQQNSLSPPMYGMPHVPPSPSSCSDQSQSPRGHHSPLSTHISPQLQTPSPQLQSQSHPQSHPQSEPPPHHRASELGPHSLETVQELGVSDEPVSPSQSSSPNLWRRQSSGEKLLMETNNPLDSHHGVFQNLLVEQMKPQTEVGNNNGDSAGRVRRVGVASSTSPVRVQPQSLDMFAQIMARPFDFRDKRKRPDVDSGSNREKSKCCKREPCGSPMSPAETPINQGTTNPSSLCSPSSFLAYPSSQEKKSLARDIASAESEVLARDYSHARVLTYEEVSYDDEDQSIASASESSSIESPPGTPPSPPTKPPPHSVQDNTFPSPLPKLMVPASQLENEGVVLKLVSSSTIKTPGSLLTRHPVSTREDTSSRSWDVLVA